MSAAALILEAQVSGIELRLVGDKVKAIGPREAITRMIEPLREHKLALVYALQKEQASAALQQLFSNPFANSSWHVLATAYNVHHFNCVTCIAAGRGSQYGQRCGAGASLWTDYCQNDSLHK